MLGIKRIALLGSSGQLGSEFLSLLDGKVDLIAPKRKEIDLFDLNNLEKWLSKTAPDVVINAAAYTSVDLAEKNRHEALALNAHLPETLACWCKYNRARLLHFSSDYVLSGIDKDIQDETTLPDPLNWYGETKIMGDFAIKNSGANALVLRTSWVYSTHHNNFLLTIMRQAFSKREMVVVNDQIGTPTPAHWLANVGCSCLKRWNQNMPRLINAVPSGFVSWHGFANAILSCLSRQGYKIQTHNVKSISSNSINQPAQRPKNSKLDNQLLSEFMGEAIDSWDDFLQELVNQVMRSNPDFLDSK